MIEEHSRGSFYAAFAAIAVVAGLSACAAPGAGDMSVSQPNVVAAPVTAVDKERLPSFTQTGLASWYGKSRRSKRTASGEKMTNTGMTAAHRSLPLNTQVRVTNLANGASVMVRINDRGPFIHGRVIDLSPAAASELWMKEAGVAPVRLEVFAADQAT
ncbi:MAG: septal ring lytic transglycosylase RlpA family protein, partial [Stellaceae bacterium]